MKSKLMRGAAFATALSAAVAGAGCSPEQNSLTYHGKTSAEEVLTRTSPTQIRPDEGKFVEVLLKGKNPKLYEALIRDLKEVDNQHQHGRTDLKAPEISNRPARFDAHVAVDTDGKDSAFILNDAACDTLRVYTNDLDGTKAYIGAIALSESAEDKVFVAWPRDENGKLSNEAYLCFFEDEEPANGVVMFADDHPR